MAGGNQRLREEGPVPQVRNQFGPIPGCAIDHRIHQGAVLAIPEENETARPAQHRALGVRRAGRVIAYGVYDHFHKCSAADFRDLSEWRRDIGVERWSTFYGGRLSV